MMMEREPHHRRTGGSARPRAIAASPRLIDPGLFVIVAIAFLSAVLLFVGVTRVWGQECLPDDAAIVQSQAVILPTGPEPDANILYVGSLGGLTGEIVPYPRDTNDNGISDVCEGIPIANVGDEIPPPVGALAGAVPKVFVPGFVDPLPATDPNVTRVFWQAVEQKLFAGEKGPVTIEWEPVSGDPLVREYQVLDDTPSVVLYLTEAPNNGPLVDLSPVLAGSTPATLVIHYNSVIQSDPVPTNSDVYVDGQNNIHGRNAGVVVLEYQNQSTGTLLALEVLEIRAPFPVVLNAVVGEEVSPGVPFDLSRQPLVTRGNNTYAFQHTGPSAGNTRWRVYSIRPNDTPLNFEVYWFRQGFGGVSWVAELSRYTADWPADPQINVRADGVPPVDMTPHASSEIKYQDPGSHAVLTSGEFSTLAPGRATVMYTDPASDGSGDVVSFVVVDSVDHTAVRTQRSWAIGEAITDEGHNNACNDGYLFEPGVAHHDPDGTVYDRDTMTGRVFPVNRGQTEMWWYERSTTRQGTPSDVCWPYKAVLYNCDWPATPDSCIIIANELGSGAFDPIKYKTPIIYSQGNPSLHGYNPNEEHARWVNTPGDPIYAARDDLNTPINPAGVSDPYVLLAYQDGDQGDTWEMDVIRVVSEVPPGSPVPGCPCDEGTNGPCTLDYEGLAGQPIVPPLPLGLDTQYCPENRVVTPGFGWNDDRGNVWFVRGGDGLTGTAAIDVEFFESWPGQGCAPWLDGGTGDPEDIGYTVSWPQIPSDPTVNPPLSDPNVYTSMSIGETRDRSGFRIAEILYNEAGAALIHPWKPTEVPLADLPTDFFLRLQQLPPTIQLRLSYDLGMLRFEGVESENLLGIMSADERDTIKDTFDSPGHAEFRSAIDALYLASQQDGMTAVGAVADPDNPDWGIAVASGPSMQAGWVVIGYNGRSDISDPVVVEVFRVDCPPFQGAVKVFAPDCPFDEQITLRWTGDCGGECGNIEFQWQVAAGDNPDDYDDVDPNETPVNPGNPWEDYVDPLRGNASGWVAGQHEITVKGANIRTLTDNWFRVRTRGYASACGGVVESDWTSAQLAEGWIKRVKRGINPFDERVDDFHATEGDVQTYVSMLEQLGEPYSDAVPLSCDSENTGLIEIYSAVLFRGKSFTIDRGVQYPPADQALILMAGALADFYMLLGNEGFGDAQDPTIAIDTGTSANAGAIFAFQDQLPTNENSLIFEELALLRGRDDRDTPTDQRSVPVYNRLFWNFTSGDGSVAYRNNYNITDRNDDGSINADDARILFPQGHGDAWGHYLTAIKSYYDLLRNPNFNWPIRSETVLVGQTPVSVSYAHERKFARAASARAKCGLEILDLTYREQYRENPAEQWQGYKDPVEGRFWGVTDWARRAHMGAQFDWLTANSRLPAEDTAHPPGSLEKVDRTTVAELREIGNIAQDIQNLLDEVDAGLNPLGLAKNAVPFDISPSQIAENKTHFEQIYERAVQTLNNTIVVFNHANTLSNHLRRFQDEQEQFDNNVEDREADYNNRLIEVFGYPFPEDRDPMTGSVFGSQANVPDLFHYAYVDVEDLVGLELPDGETRRVFFEVPMVDPDTGSITKVETQPVDFNVVPGFGLVKPRSFTQPRRAPGEIQMARSDLLQANARLRTALENYDLAVAAIEDKAALLQSFYDISSEEIAVLEEARDTQQNLNNFMLFSRARQLEFQLNSRRATEIANAVADGLPSFFIAGLSNGGDFTAPARAAIRLAGIAVGDAFTRSADAEQVSELQYSLQKDNLNNQTQITLQLLRTQREAEILVKEIEQAVRGLNPLEIEIYAQQEAVRQASGRYMGAIAKGQRLIEERTRFRQHTAAQVSNLRYKDMAFRIFRNDALQKYRAQFDLAVRYVYLAAKAYDYETNLLSADPRSGEEFFGRIVRERTIGQIESGFPLVGRGLADILARLSQNFESIKGQLRFNNPQTETNRFSLRRELFRISNTGLASNAIWQETLERHRVDDLRNHEEFRKYCDPLRVIVNASEPQPAIVIPVETTITPGVNFFGWPASGGDSFYSAQNFTTKVRSVGVWFSNYNNTASIGGLVQTPRVFLVPAGADVMRVPTVNSGSPREWFLLDQVLPSPFPINSVDLVGNRDWLPEVDNFGGSSDFGRPRRFGDFRAYHDGGTFNQAEVVTDTRLIGRSVWNTRWLLIIPGINLLGDPETGIDRFIRGNGNPGEGITDILVFFQTYAYTSG